MKYYIQNRLPVGNCVLWWREGGNGYTCDLDKAGLFDETEAPKIVKSRPDIDIAWKRYDVEAYAVRHVDLQNLISNFQPLRSA